MEERLRELLKNHRYNSSMGLGMRGLMQHHIDALVRDLLPFIENEVDLEIDKLLKEELDFNPDQQEL